MYKELEKYRTNRTKNIIGVLPDKKKANVSTNVFSAKLGDLMEDFIKHQTKPRWRRKYYHDDLTRIYIDTLNLIETDIVFKDAIFYIKSA